MQIINKLPPNWEVLGRVFKGAESSGAIFCYGDVIYNPFGTKVTPDMEVHEGVHSKRQAEFYGGVIAWWEKYVTDKDFRFNEELIAYATQYAYVKRTVKDGKLVMWLLDKCAEAMSGNLYGFGVRFNEARCKIKNFATLSNVL